MNKAIVSWLSPRIATSTIPVGHSLLEICSHSWKFTSILPKQSTGGKYNYSHPSLYKISLMEVEQPLIFFKPQSLPLEKSWHNEWNVHILICSQILACSVILRSLLWGCGLCDFSKRCVANFFWHMHSYMEFPHPHIIRFQGYSARDKVACLFTIWSRECCVGELWTWVKDRRTWRRQSCIHENNNLLLESQHLLLAKCTAKFLQQTEESDATMLINLFKKISL